MYQETALKIIAEAGDLKEAAKAIVSGPRALLLYVVTIGLESIRAKQRRKRRHELRVEVQPEFKAGRTTGSIVLTEASKKRLLRNTQSLFGEDGWMIGDLNLGDFTKEALLAQASKERASAKGSMRNASFYEALAEPLRAGQKTRDFWKPEAARKLRREIWRDTKDQTARLVGV